MVLLGALSALALAAPTTALAAAKNVNFDGKWTVVDSSDSANSAILTITNENLTTGTFGGSLTSTFDGSRLPIVDGQVIGTRFMLTIQKPGTVVGQNGMQSEYAGTITANTLTMTATGIQLWHNGHPVSVTTGGSGIGTR